MKLILLPSVLMAATLVACGTSASPSGTVTVTVTAPAGGATTEAAEDSETPEPEPTEDGGTFSSECDYNLDFDNGHTFTAAAFIEGATPGANVKVTATWRQVSGKHIVVAKKVTVGADGTAEAYFEKPASDAQIDAIQALPTQKQCKVEAGLV